MSSSPWRGELSGTIRQDEKVIGSICLPEEHVQEFIDEFNHCYGPLRLPHRSPPVLAAGKGTSIPRRCQPSNPQRGLYRQPLACGAGIGATRTGPPVSPTRSSDSNNSLVARAMCPCDTH